MGRDATPSDRDAIVGGRDATPSRCRAILIGCGGTVAGQGAMSVGEDATFVFAAQRADRETRSSAMSA